MAQLGNEVGRQRIHINLEAHRQRRVGTQAWSDAPQGSTLDRVVQLQRAAPIGFVAKRVESKCLLTLGKALQSVGLDCVMGLAISRNLLGDRRRCDLIGRAGRGRCDTKCEYAAAKPFHRNPPSFARARRTRAPVQCAPCIDLKKRKKLEPTAIALPADSAASMPLDDVMPLLPSAAGPIARVQYQYRPHLPADRPRVDAGAVHNVAVIRCGNEDRCGGRPGVGLIGSQLDKLGNRAMHAKCQ